MKSCQQRCQPDNQIGTVVSTHSANANVDSKRNVLRLLHSLCSICHLWTLIPKENVTLRLIPSQVLIKMITHENIISFLDLLDLDEELIDTRLQTIMKREKHSNKQLYNATKLLQYKHLINLHDNNDCDNKEEVEFAVKLLKEISKENIDYICEIVFIALALNKENLVAKSEHLLQQLLVEFPLTDVNNCSEENTTQTNTLVTLKVIDNILNAAIKCEKTLYLPFLDLPLNTILLSTDEKMKNHFLGSTVPKLFETVIGNNILDNIWLCVCRLESVSVEITLKVLSYLSDYYLPIRNNRENILFESNIYYQYQFWNYILIGMLSGDLTSRKLAVYLAKRAIDCAIALQRDICVILPDNIIIFQWIHTNSKFLQVMWNNFFILLDSLEEKQSNIVLPSLKLFDSLSNIGVWLKCALSIGLKHENTQVKLQCILHRLNTQLHSQTEAKLLLEALNDINIYDSNKEVDKLKTNLIAYFKNEDVLKYIFMSLPEIKWSAVPLFHLSDVLAKGQFKCLTIRDQVQGTVIDVLKIPCNSTVLRRATHINILHFIGNSCMQMYWKDSLNIYCNLKLHFLDSKYIDNPFLPYITKCLSIDKIEEEAFFQCLTESHLYIDVTFLYLLGHEDCVEMYNNFLCEKLVKMENIISRQYSDKTECLNDVIYLIQVFYKTINKEYRFMETAHNIISSRYKSILIYITSVLSSNLILPLESIILICTGLNSMSIEIKDDAVKDILLQLYRTCIIFMKDKNTMLEICVMSLGIVEILLRDKIMIANYSHEMLDCNDVIMLATKFSNQKYSDGRLKNILHERATEIVYSLLKDNEIERHFDVILEYIQTVIESGGYGCLTICLKLIIKILKFVKEKESNLCNEHNINGLIARIWKEIDELKSNKQYNPCIEEFIELITHDTLINTPAYNNTVTFHCKQIIDYGSLKTKPLYLLIKSLSNKKLTAEYGHLIYILCDILLYSAVPRRDQRISDNLVIEVLKVPKYGFNNKIINHHFNYHIEWTSVLALTKIKDDEILGSIKTLIKHKIDDSFKNKQRYHAYSQAHRLLLKSVQHLLLTVRLNPLSHDNRTLDWCIDMLGKLPHQSSVRVCLEWYIALQLYIMKMSLDEEILRLMSKVPLTSQLVIVYWVVRRRIYSECCSNREYEFVMNTLLSHTMGQIFSIRLHAQYLANKLYQIKKCENYTCIIKVIQTTFAQSANDKNFIKFQKDYFINDFDIVGDLTPSFLYYTLPRSCESNNNELVDFDYIREIIKDITENIKANQPHVSFYKEWSSYKKSDFKVFALHVGRHEESTTINDMDSTGTIQKKYVPWKNMTDINMYETEKKKQNKSELIVVASLIDKLPNLGGMARTSEVFGVKTYVVDSLRHLQDRQFQGLSVSAERWINVEEVRPGAPLKTYLMAKKAEGYSVVAAEQTSTSCTLQSFKFPKKTLLLLGHEKKGIPCDLLPIMDYCVEIPQQGLVRSLNVHVTAAIFIWEYTWQNILKVQPQ